MKRQWPDFDGDAHDRHPARALGGWGGECRVVLRSGLRGEHVVDDPDRVLAQAISGATEAAAVAEEHGWRLGRIVDPFGHEWEIGRPVADWPAAPEASS